MCGPVMGQHIKLQSMQIGDNQGIIDVPGIRMLTPFKKKGQTLTAEQK